MSSRQKVIIDCDVGTDDAQAICICLAHPATQLIAVTSCFGNTSLKHTSNNTLRLLKAIGRLDIPVFKGHDKALYESRSKGIEATSDGFVGFDGLGDIPDNDPPDLSLLQSEHSSDALVRLANQHPGEITLVLTAPLTNLAKAMQTDPSCTEKFQKIVVMGGSLGKGNKTPHAEFNFWADPESANYVLENTKSEITLIDLEICRKASPSWAWYDKFISTSTKIGGLMKEWEKVMVKNLTSNPQETQADEHKYEAIWDQLAMAVAIQPDIVKESYSACARVDTSDGEQRGKTNIIEGSAPQNVVLIDSIDQDTFEELIYSGIRLK